MSFDDTLKGLGIELPAPPKPVASYVPAVVVGDLLYLSGMLPFRSGQVVITGKLGQDVTVERCGSQIGAAQCIGGGEARTGLVGSCAANRACGGSCRVGWDLHSSLR